MPLGVAAELHTLIGVYDGASRPPLLHGRGECVQDHVTMERWASGPFDNLRENGRSRRKVQPPLALPVSRFRVSTAPPCRPPSAACDSHEPSGGRLPASGGHTMYAARLGRLPKIEEDPRRPVNTVARAERCPDLRSIRASSTARAECAAFQPLVVPTGRDAQHPAHHLRWKQLPLGLDDRLLLPNTSCFGFRWHVGFLSIRC